MTNVRGYIISYNTSRDFGGISNREFPVIILGYAA